MVEGVVQAQAPVAAMPQPVLVVGTASVHVRRFVAGLCAAGQPVVLVTEGDEPLHEHALVLEQVAVDFRVRSLGTARAIARAIQRWQPRVVHAHQANSVAWHAARGCAGHGVPLVLTLWGSDVLLMPHLSPLHRWMVRSTLRRAALWTADSAHVLAQARRVASVVRPSARVVMGVDTWPQDLQDVWPLKRERILSCRLHKPLYRVDEIIKAYAKLAPHHPGWRLEVAAAGPETGTLVALAQRSGTADGIDFTGFLAAAAMTQALRAASVYVSFPLSDGTSVSLLEALAHGCCPVVSDLPANREWVVDGLNGVVVLQPADLPAAIERAIEISRSERWRRETAPANLRLVREHATFADNMQQFMAQYVRLGR
jgi:glycosyltransferase involved in cell wall biosynthesis